MLDAIAGCLASWLGGLNFLWWIIDAFKTYPAYSEA